MPIRLIVCLLALLSQPASAQIDTYADTEFVLSGSSTPPPDTSAWQRQQLPDIWRNNHPAGSKSGWYRIRFPLQPDAHVAYGLYLPKLDMNTSIWLNDDFIGDGGNMEEPISRNWNRPLLFTLPYGAIHRGENILYIRIVGNAYTQPALFPVEVGPISELRPKFEKKSFLHVTLNHIAFVLISLTGLLMISLWWRRKSEIAYGSFGISALLWGVQSANLTIHNVPLITHTAQWEVVINASFQIIAALLLSSILRFLGIWNPRWAPWFRTLLVASPISLTFVPESHFLQLTSFWHLATVFTTIFTLGHTLRAAKQGNRDARYLVTALLTVVLFALHDWLMHSAHLFDETPEDMPLGDIQLLQYSAPLLFLAIGWIMTSRYLRTLDEFEHLNNELDQRVRQKQTELEATYARVKEMEMTQAVAAERDRIHGDLHDDVGAKLLSLVYRAENKENAALAREALQDLRDVVSQRNEDRDLVDLAADWRAECERRFAESGLALSWETQGSLGGNLVNPHLALNLTRLLREAISNIIRHSKASKARICIASSGGHLRLNIADNGVGLPEPRKPGRGQLNMQARASRIGASLRFYTPDSGGCGVVVDIPIRALEIK